VVAAGALAASAAFAAPTDWAGDAFGPDARAPAAAGRWVSTDDILRLRNIGGMGVSPDGAWVAFSIYQAAPETNRYVMRWFLQPTTPGGSPRPLEGDGGQPIPNLVGGLPQAWVAPAPPRWSPDGRMFAFRRMVDHRIELWVAGVSGQAPTRVADGQAQVDRFGWTAKGRLIFRTGLDYDRYRAKLAQEARHGWLHDGLPPVYAAQFRPDPPDCGTRPDDAACDVQTLSWRPGGTAPATTEEVAQLAAFYPARWRELALPPEPWISQRGGDGAQVTAEAVPPDPPTAQKPVRRLEVVSPQGRIACPAVACRGQFFRGAGWARGGASVWFMKGEDSLGGENGPPSDRVGLYEWTPSSGRVRKVAAAALLENCQIRGTTAYCQREDLTRPAHLVAIDLDSRTVRMIADPNPALQARTYPKVRPIRFNDSDGDPGVAYLVYPADYAPGRHYPLVITQYRQRGFLRAQVGAEYPILPLAAEGYFVLSIDRPDDYARMRRINPQEIDSYRVSPGAPDRRKARESIDALVDQLVGEGLVDNARVALTGLSAGAEAGHYILQRTGRFAAAILSSGTHDMTFFALMPGDRSSRAVEMRIFQTPELMPSPTNVVSELAWSNKPERLTTPLLVNVGEYEAMIGFEGLEALKQAGRPIEERVFPDEMHVKYHPQTYAGIYENNLMWLKFWLEGVEDPRPEFATQYVRWRAMRDRLNAEKRR
jgi:dipeptidyl aminopeptidase/acylaminoacyl peptidase